MDDQTNQLNEEHKPVSRTMMIVVALAFLALVTILVGRYLPTMMGKGKAATDTTYIAPPSPPVVLEKGSLTLTVAEASASATVGFPVTVMVIGDSNGKSVTGYDAVVTYDPTKVEYRNHTGLLPEFQLFTEKQSNKVLVSAVKALDATETSVFTRTEMVELVFVPLKAGKMELGLEFIPTSTRDSNIIDSTNKDVLGDVHGVTIQVSP
jgi:hypothetical protein